MAANGTQAHDGSVAAFLDRADPPRRRDEGRALADLMARISGCPAEMWGASIVGFGRYHYRYNSGREGDACRIGFSPRKTALVLYLPAVIEERTDLLERLGKHKTGVGCLYLTRLSDADPQVLEGLVAAAWATMAERHPG